MNQTLWYQPHHSYALISAILYMKNYRNKKITENGFQVNSKHYVSRSISTRNVYQFKEIENFLRTKVKEHRNYAWICPSLCNKTGCSFFQAIWKVLCNGYPLTYSLGVLEPK